MKVVRLIQRAALRVINYGNGTVNVTWKPDCLGKSPPNPPDTYYHCDFGPLEILQIMVELVHVA